MNRTLNEMEKLFQECNVELKRRVERLERYSRDFHFFFLGGGGVFVCFLLIYCL